MVLRIGCVVVLACAFHIIISTVSIILKILSYDVLI